MAGPHTPCPPQSCGVLGPGAVARHGRNHDSRWRGPLLSAGFMPQSGPGPFFHTPVVISLGRVRAPLEERPLLGSSGIYRDSRWFILTQDLRCRVRADPCRPVVVFLGRVRGPWEGRSLLGSPSINLREWRSPSLLGSTSTNRDPWWFI